MTHRGQHHHFRPKKRLRMGNNAPKVVIKTPDGQQRPQRANVVIKMPRRDEKDNIFVRAGRAAFAAFLLLTPADGAATGWHKQKKMSASDNKDHPHGGTAIAELPASNDVQLRNSASLLEIGWGSLDIDKGKPRPDNDPLGLHSVSDFWGGSTLPHLHHRGDEPYKGDDYGSGVSGSLAQTTNEVDIVPSAPAGSPPGGPDGPHDPSPLDGRPSLPHGLPARPPPPPPPPVHVEFTVHIDPSEGGVGHIPDLTFTRRPADTSLGELYRTVERRIHSVLRPHGEFIVHLYKTAGSVSLSGDLSKKLDAVFTTDDHRITARLDPAVPIDGGGGGGGAAVLGARDQTDDDEVDDFGEASFNGASSGGAGPGDASFNGSTEFSDDQAITRSLEGIKDLARTSSRLLLDLAAAAGVPPGDGIGRPSEGGAAVSDAAESDAILDELTQQSLATNVAVQVLIDQRTRRQQLAAASTHAVTPQRRPDGDGGANP